LYQKPERQSLTNWMQTYGYRPGAQLKPWSALYLMANTAISHQLNIAGATQDIRIKIPGLDI